MVRYVNFNSPLCLEMGMWYHLGQFQLQTEPDRKFVFTSLDQPRVTMGEMADGVTFGESLCSNDLNLAVVYRIFVSVIMR